MGEVGEIEDRNTMPIKLSVIIPAYNEEEYLPKCLAALKQARSQLPGQADVETIVVDNASTDRTAEIAKAEGARIVKEPEHHLSKIRNTGARAARGEHLLFVDADSIVHTSTLKCVVQMLENDHVIGGGGYVAYDGRRFYRFISDLLNFVVVRRGGAWGTFIYCRNDAFRSIGGFDESLYGTEELAFAKALRKEAKRTGAEFAVIREILVTASSRRLHKQIPMLAKRPFLIFNLRKNMQDPELCRKVWYDVDR